MKDIKIIIGANYGDEGKGLAANFFAKQYRKEGKTNIVVLHNGGFQRGHTVLENNIRHVFHAFGSGTFQFSPTYYASTFILNPMFFRLEYEELSRLGFTPKVYVNPKCRITCPYDVMINQIVEDYRDKNRHGSCGYGVFETVKRHEVLPFTVKDAAFTKDIDGLVISFLNEYRKSYIFDRLEFYGVDAVPIGSVRNIYNENIVYQYIDDLIFMLNHMEVKDTQFITEFDSIIFEGSQGLMLDNDRPVNKDYLTASKTGIFNPSNIIKELDYLGYLTEYNVETAYITRTYFTRHGNGDFPQECPKKKINPGMVDKTNMPNHYQGTLRYGYMDIEEMTARIMEDASLMKGSNPCLFVTHLNETGGDFFEQARRLAVTEIPLVRYISSKEEQD